jgi:hypothetical protein
MRIRGALLAALQLQAGRESIVIGEVQSQAAPDFNGVAIVQ